MGRSCVFIYYYLQVTPRIAQYFPDNFNTIQPYVCLMIVCMSILCCITLLFSQHNELLNLIHYTYETGFEKSHLPCAIMNI